MGERGVPEYPKVLLTLKDIMKLGKPHLEFTEHWLQDYINQQIWHVPIAPTVAGSIDWLIDEPFNSGRCAVITLAAGDLASFACRLRHGMTFAAMIEMYRYLYFEFCTYYVDPTVLNQATTFIGLAEAETDLRTTNQIMGFGLKTFGADIGHQIVTDQGGVEQVADINVDLAWQGHRYGILIDNIGGTVSYYFDGILRATHTHVPAAGTKQLIAYMDNTLGGSPTAFELHEVLVYGITED